MDRNTLVGRGLSVLDYTAYQRIQERVTPMLTDTKHISEIVDHVKANHFTDDQYMQNLLTVACIYDFYCPASFFAKSIAKMQIGVRDELAKCIGYKNPEMCNYFLDRSKPFMKFREKGFGQRVENIKSIFKHLSVREIDWKLEL